MATIKLKGVAVANLSKLFGDARQWNAPGNPMRSVLKAFPEFGVGEVYDDDTFSSVRDVTFTDNDLKAIAASAGNFVILKADKLSEKEVAAFKQIAAVCPLDDYIKSHVNGVSQNLSSITG